MPEWLLDDDPAPGTVLILRKIWLAQLLHRGGKELRRDGEVKEVIAVRPVDLIDFLQLHAQALIGFAVAEFALHIIGMTFKPIHQFRIGALGELLERIADMLAKLIGSPAILGHADDGELARQQSGAQQVVDRWQQLALGKVAGRTEDDHYAGTGGLGVWNVCLYGRCGRHRSPFSAAYFLSTVIYRLSS